MAGLEMHGMEEPEVALQSGDGGKGEEGEERLSSGSSQGPARRAPGQVDKEPKKAEPQGR